MLALSEQYTAQRSMHRYAVYLFAAIISVMLSSWISLRETVINPDAICYLLSAQTMTDHGFKAGMQFCPQAMWPFYSFLLSSVVQLTHVSYQFAASALDALFTAITVVAFIAIIDTLGASKRVLWLAAAVILLSHEFNYVRQYIVRDHGFWAFYLLSMLCMLRFMCVQGSSTLITVTTERERGKGVRPRGAGSDPFSPFSSRRSIALLWIACLIIATLFRVEGAIFILALPFAAFFMQENWRARFKLFFGLNALTLIAGAAFVGWLALHPEQASQKLGRLPEVTQQLQSGAQMIMARFHAMRDAMIQHVLTQEAARDASLMLGLMLLAAYLLNVIGNLSWIYAALVAYAWLNRVAKFTRPAFIVVMAYLLINIAITFCFYAQHLFLAKRYLIALTLTLMIWVPFALDRLIEKSVQPGYRKIMYATVTLMCISAMGGIFDFGYSKWYIREAGSWLANNVPAQTKLYVNDPQLMYYSEHNRDVFFNVIKDYVDLQNLAENKWKQYDYIALRLPHDPDEKTTTIVRALPLSSTVEFANKRGDKVVIYKNR